ncbi:MAG TPA: hypothetical protein VER11_31705 [Polyangiaceae bacterium]|nr:hypothetical protein [Polyangiaceae bacterium]
MLRATIASGVPYDDFARVDNDEVLRLLDRAWREQDNEPDVIA